ncbi:hypothetical protein GCM10012319_04610 [Comamonas sp. KCTC 72670]|nr:hypothetical protein GCM10012319_04610 [Comamonas sp. KCTC 72670]
MRRPLRNLLVSVALGAGLSACSLLVDFDEEGQPCDELFQCLDNYTCVDNACVPLEGGGDGGVRPDGGSGDAGSGDAGSGDAGEPDAGEPDAGGEPGPTNPAPTDPVPNNPTS